MDAETMPGSTTCSEEELALRQDTAAAFRLLDRYGMSDLTNGSVVSRPPGEEGWFLTHPHGLFFDEIRASDLDRVDMDGNAIDDPGTPANFAVASIFRARPGVNAVIHAHGVGVMAVATQEHGLLPSLTGAAIPFYDQLGYIEGDFFFEPEYCARIALRLGRNRALIYQHHAFASVGARVSEAFFYAVSLNTACERQMKITSSAEPYVVPSGETCERHYRAAYGGDWKADGSVEWPGLRRMLDRDDPSYAR